MSARCNFSLAPGFPSQRGIVLVWLCLLFLCGFTVHTQGSGELGWEGVEGDASLYPVVTAVRRVPYLFLTGSGSLEHPLGGELRLNSGILYLDGISSPPYYRERYFLQDLYARIALDPLQVGVGWFPQILAGGRLTNADNPGIYLNLKLSRSLRLSAGGYRVVLHGLTFAPGSPDAQYGTMRYQGKNLTGELGILRFRDQAGAMREVFEPLAPVVIRRICARLTPRQCLLLIERIIENNGYLKGSRTLLYSPWGSLRGYLGPLELSFQGIFQGGDSQLVDLAGTPHPMTHEAYALEGEIRWVETDWEAALGGLLLSGGVPLQPYFHSFLGIQTYWDDTFLFFGQGIRADLAGSFLLTPGTAGLGTRALFLRGLYAGEALQAQGYGAFLFSDETIPGRSETFYGIEIGGELSYPLPYGFSLGARGAWLGGGDFPIPQWGTGPRLETPLLSPTPLWFLAVLLRWEGDWSWEND